MATQQQFRGLGVALHSQLQSARTAAYLTLYSLRPKLAQAALAERRARADGAAALPADPAQPGPAAQLVAAYVVAPVLALAAWWVLAQWLGNRMIAGVLAGLVLLLPPLTQLAYGAVARAWLGVASLLGYLALGAAGGAALARTLALRACIAEGPDECGLAVLGWLLVGAFAGGLLGYCAHAVRQVRRAARSSVASARA